MKHPKIIMVSGAKDMSEKEHVTSGYIRLESSLRRFYLVCGDLLVVNKKYVNNCLFILAN